jgi:hypothetical protein
LLKNHKKPTITSREIQTAVRLVLPSAIDNNMDLTSHSPLLKTTITFLLFSLVSKTMSYSTFQTHTPENTNEGSKEFSFWTSPNTIITSFEKCDCHNIQLGGNETQVLNSHHLCSIVSEPSRSKNILEGKKELMEMMQDMSESSYELSFQDMVVEKLQVPQPEPETERV